MAFKEYRSMKVCEQSGHNYKPTPTITLKGQWLEGCGFDMGVPITVRCEDGRLTITRTDQVIVTYCDVTANQPISKVTECVSN